MQIESPYHEGELLVQQAKLKRLNKMGALLLTKFSKVRSNSLNSSRLLYLAAWIVSRIFGLQSMRSSRICESSRSTRG